MTFFHHQGAFYKSKWAGIRISSPSINEVF